MFGKKIKLGAVLTWLLSQPVWAESYQNPFRDDQCMLAKGVRPASGKWLKWPLQGIKLVGVMTTGTRKVAWLQSGQNKVQTLQVGDYLGVEPMQVMAIDDQGLSYQGQTACHLKALKGHVGWDVAQGKQP
jgi:hypothetical protein